MHFSSLSASSPTTRTCSRAHERESLPKLKQRLRDRSKEMHSKLAVQTKQMLFEQAVKIAKRAEEHERFIYKVTIFLGSLSLVGFAFYKTTTPLAMVKGKIRETSLNEGRFIPH